MGSFDKFISAILPGYKPFAFTEKAKNTQNHIGYMLNRTSSMFKWNGLPETIPARSLELYLQCNGNTCIAEYGGAVYAFVGGMGGEPDPYYMPTQYVVANPALKMSKTYNIGVDCVVIPNDPLYMGLLPLYQRYATQLTEAELTLNIALINSRMPVLFEAMDDRTKSAADKVIEDLHRGKLSVVGSKGLAGSIHAMPFSDSNTRTITDLIESIQYVKASWYNEIGLDANYNMKRESINSGESQLNRDALKPLVDIMLEYRKRGAEAVNAMFGTSFSVDLASSWEDNEIELEAEQEAISNQSEYPETENSEAEGGEEDREVEDGE